MKKFFTKFIQIEGEVSEGDYYSILSVGTPQLREEGLYPKWGNIKKYAGNVHDKLIHLMHKEHVHKYELCICSYDIQVGDKFIIPQDYMEVQGELYLGNIGECTSINKNVFHYSIPCLIGGTAHSGVFRTDNPFKIIGKVSSKALWVTEDMFFDEDELKKIIFDGVEYNSSINSSSPALRIEIKCSVCKKFY